jgi:hypothetical protein
MLHGILEDNGRRDYPDTLLPVEDTSQYEVRSEGTSITLTSRQAATRIAHDINIYSVYGDTAHVIEWRLEGDKRVGVAL